MSPGKMLAHRQFLDGVAILEHGLVDLLRRRRVEIEVEWRQAAFDVEVLDHQIVPLFLEQRWCQRAQRFEEFDREALLRQQHLRELEGIGHPADPVHLLDHQILALDRLAVHLLARSEHILDQLEDVGV
jgi:hypothetical protein